LSEFGDLETLSKNIGEVLENKSLRNKLGNSGYEKLKKEFNIKTNVKKLMGVFKEISKNEYSS
jgi:glycosyltransferase involved in cell wall biosynthesis